MLTRRTKKTPKRWNQGQWNILFFSEQMFYFVGFSLGKQNYTLKATQNLTCFFFCFEKLERTTKQKKETKCSLERTKKTPKWWNQGQWNILFFSEQMFYFVGFSLGKQKLLTKSNSKPNMFLFLFRKTWTDKQTKKRNEMLTRKTKKNSKMVKSGSMKYFILLWTNVLFCRILTGKNQSTH